MVPADRGEMAVSLSGTVEASTATISFRVGGYIETLSVDEGDRVKKGATLAMLDARDLRVALEAAESERAMAAASLEELENGSRQEEIEIASADVIKARAALSEMEGGFRIQQIDEARARLNRAIASRRSAKATLDMAKADDERFGKLFKSGSIGQREYESYRTAYRNAQESLHEAKAAVDIAEQQLGLLKEGSRREDIQQARSSLQRTEAYYRLVESGPREETKAKARAGLQMAMSKKETAELRLEYAELKAPFDGTIMVKATEAGENVSPGTPVFSIAKIGSPWIRCFVQETDLPRIFLGQTATVSMDGSDRIFQGRVSYISSMAEFTPKNVETREERVNLMYRVKVQIDDNDGSLKIGMPVTVSLGQ